MHELDEAFDLFVQADDAPDIAPEFPGDAIAVANVVTPRVLGLYYGGIVAVPAERWHDRVWKKRRWWVGDEMGRRQLASARNLGVAQL